MSRAVDEAEALLEMGAKMVDAGTLRVVLDELARLREKHRVLVRFSWHERHRAHAAETALKDARARELRGEP